MARAARLSALRSACLACCAAVAAAGVITTTTYNGASCTGTVNSTVSAPTSFCSGGIMLTCTATTVGIITFTDSLCTTVEDTATLQSACFNTSGSAQGNSESFSCASGASAARVAATAALAAMFAVMLAML